MWIKLRLNAGEAKSGPPLAPILGQHQINLVEFCKLFNAKSTELYNTGTPIRLRLYKKQKLPIAYFYKPINIYTLVNNFCIYYNRSRYITLFQIYDIFIIRNIEMTRLNILIKDKKLILRQILGFIKSTNIKIIK